MRVALFAILLAIQVPASAVDFRGVQIGQTCRHASEVELSLGTQPKADIESMLNLGTVMFEDRRIADRHAIYMYSCKHTQGIISRYSIDIRTRSDSLARAIYADAKTAAVSRLGAPRFDSDAPEAKEKARQLRYKGLTDNYAVANWSSSDRQHVSLMLEKLPDNDEWSVATIVSEASRDLPDKLPGRTE